MAPTGRVTAEPEAAVVTAQSAALAALRERLLTGRLKPGQPVRQQALAAELGLSIVPVREALTTLQSEGLIDYRPNRGFTVAELDLDDLTEAYRLREVLEGEAVREALPRLTAADIDQLGELAHEFQRLAAEGPSLELSRVNRAFHFLILQRSGMPRCLNFIRMLWDATEVYRVLAYTVVELRGAAAREHREIVALLRAGRLDDAALQLRRHMHALPVLKEVMETVDRS